MNQTDRLTHIDRNIIFLHMWVIKTSDATVSILYFIYLPIDEISEDELRAKKSELRLYCDLLMQQVHSVKQAVNKEDKSPPDIEVGPVN